MNIEFIGHAGFCIRVDGLQVLVDPWITPSTFENPILNSFASGHRSIDYLIPEPVRKLEDFDPDVILMSHYHSHHSSKLDIEYWLKKSTKKVDVVGPNLYTKNEEDFLDYFRKEFPHHKFIQVETDKDFEYRNLKIKCLTHTEKHHLAYHFATAEGSFLHVADARINRIPYYRNLDPVWFKFYKMNPTLFVCSVGTMSSRGEDKESGPYILENSFPSAVEAAILTQQIKPKLVAVMGVFNFSIWKNRTEFCFSPQENEAYFSWAVNHLDKEIDVAQLRPGMNFEIKNGGYALKLRPQDKVVE